MKDQEKKHMYLIHQLWVRYISPYTVLLKMFQVRERYQSELSCEMNLEDYFGHILFNLWASAPSLSLLNLTLLYNSQKTKNHVLVRATNIDVLSAVVVAQLVEIRSSNTHGQTVIKYI